MNEATKTAKSPNSRRTRPKALVALLLTFTAGLVDIVGLLTVYDLFTAHMTGTTVHLGEQLVLRHWIAAFLAAVIVFAFLAGSIAGRILIEAAARRMFRRVASITLLIELFLLFAVAAWGTNALHARRDQILISVVCPLLGMLAAAMGIQTATLTKIGPLTVHTTFVTGMLNKLAQLLSRWIFLTHDLRRQTATASPHIPAALREERDVVFQESGLLVAVWFFYLAGAICGTWLTLRWQLQSLYLAGGILIVAILVDQSRPLSIEEEKEQEE